MRFGLLPTAASPVAAAGATAADAQLLRRCAAGEGAALAQLYRRHGAAVYRYAWLLTGSETAAADIVQDSFIALLDRAGGFDPARGSCAAYLCGIARHLAARQFDARLESRADIEAMADAVAAHDLALPPVPQDDAERAQALTRLYAAIRRLAPHYSDVLVLVELQEFSYAEVAAITGIEPGTVRSRLARARERLRELLAADGAIAGEGTRSR
jgi:RNA polymerase sigma-70 factor, ECF subfamily